MTKGPSGLLVVRLNRWALCILRTRGLADLQTRGLALEIFTAGILFSLPTHSCEDYVSIAWRPPGGLGGGGLRPPRSPVVPPLRKPERFEPQRGSLRGYPVRNTVSHPRDS